MFTTPVTAGGTYDVTVLSQPSNPSQVCVVSGGSGSVTANVTSTEIICTTNSYTIGGTVAGLSGSGLILQDNAGNNLSVPTGATSFVFSAAVMSGSTYNVTILTQPANPVESCIVSGGSGTVGSTDIVTVQVSCSTTTAATYTIGGGITGLLGFGLVLQDNGGNNLTVNTGATGFTFTAAIPGGTTYNVTVLTQPSSPAQACSVIGGSGTASANVASVQIACTTNAYTIGGTISGLSGGGLVLQDNGGNNLSVSAGAASFMFSTAIASGSAYSVVVFSQPSSPWQTCSVTSGSGQVTSENITTVQVLCATNTYTIGGTVSGLSGTGLVLQDNGGNNLPVGVNGNFSFTAAVASGAGYSVTVLTQPTSPNQSCDVTNGGGTVTSSNISDVLVVCATNTYTVGGTVAGLTGSGLVLQDNGGNNLAVSSNGAFAFSAPVASGTGYNVTVLTQPTNPSQVCSVSAGSGTVTNAAIDTVAVTCNSPILSSIQVLPANPTLAIGLTQQFVAIGTYNNGTTANITSSVVWSASAASATVSPSGLVTTVSQGGASITATSGSIMGSSNVVVPNATGGLVLIDDLTDSRILSWTASDMSTITILGTRDSSGNPTSFTNIKRVATDGTWEDISLDSQGRPTTLLFSDNSQVSLNWTSTATATATALSSDGTTVVSSQIGSSQTNAQSVRAAFRSRYNLLRDSANTASSTATTGTGNSLVTVRVTSCNNVPENWAYVTVTPNSALGGEPVDASLVAGTGIYLAQLPSGPTNLSLATEIQEAAEFYEPICNFSETFSQGGVELQQAICGVSLLLGPEAGLICEGSEALLNAIDDICMSGPVASAINSVVNFLSTPTEIEVLVLLPGESPQQSSEQVLPSGGFGPLNITFQCPPVDHLTVIANPTTINVGASSQVTAVADNASGEVLGSSALDFVWSNGNDNNGVLGVPVVNTSNGYSSVVDVTGLTPGGPVQVLATEQSSGKTGSAAITVSGPQVTITHTGANSGVEVSVSISSGSTTVYSNSFTFGPAGSATGELDVPLPVAPGTYNLSMYLSTADVDFAVELDLTSGLTFASCTDGSATLVSSTEAVGLLESVDLNFSLRNMMCSMVESGTGQ